MKTSINRFLLAAGLLILSGLSATAQTTEVAESKFYLEGQTGVNISRVWFGAAVGDYKPGATGGLSLGYEIGNHFFVESGLAYDNKGYQVDLYKNVTVVNPNVPIYNRIKQNYHYVSVPLRAGFKFGNKVEFVVKQGINTALLAQTHTRMMSGDGLPDRHDYNSIQHLNRLEISFTNSIGFNIPVGKYYFGSSFAQNMSLTSLQKEDLIFVSGPNGPIVGRNYLFSGNVHFGFRF